MSVANTPRCLTCGSPVCVDKEHVPVCFHPACQRIAHLEAINAQLLAACEAVLDAISGDLGGMVLWINPPHQAPGVHETAHERLMTAIKSAKGSQ